MCDVYCTQIDDFIISIRDSFGSLENAYKYTKFIFKELTECQTNLKRLLRTKKHHMVQDRFKSLYEELKASNISFFDYCGNVYYREKEDYARHVQAFVDNNKRFLLGYHYFYVFLKNLKKGTLTEDQFKQIKDYAFIGKMYLKHMGPFNFEPNIARMNEVQREVVFPKIQNTFRVFNQIAKGE